MGSKYTTFIYKIEGIEGTHTIMAKDSGDAIEHIMDDWEVPEEKITLL